jgi:hypothetical protein
MTSQNSSTFSFDSGRYLAGLAAGLVAILGIFFSISYYGVDRGLIDHPYQANYRFQLAKIERSAPVETLFVGDSSLGAMMDSEVWIQHSGQPSLHLALTGSDGYAGSLNMVRRSVDRLRPRNVVIVHTLDMMTRDVAYLGFLQSNPDPASERDIPLYSRIVERFLLYVSREFIVGTLRGSVRRILGQPTTHMGLEYIRLPDVSGASAEIRHGRHPALDERAINPEKSHFLEQLVKLCNTRTLNCVYAHGPIYDEVCRTSQAFIRAVDRHIRGTGIKVAEGTPVCVPRTELADTIDHVRQDIKAQYTARYYRQVAPYLDSGGPKRPLISHVKE